MATVAENGDFLLPSKEFHFKSRVFVVGYYFDVRWKALTLAHRMVCQTLFSDTLGPMAAFEIAGWPRTSNLGQTI